MCDDDCAKVERKKVLADAFGVVPPNLDALHFGDTATISEVLSDLLRRDAKWVLSVEERCKYLVLGKSRGGMNSLKVHVFCPMSKEKRDAVRLIADRWKLSIHSAGWEPKRFVVVHVTPKSKSPARVLGLKSANPSHMLQPSLYDPLVDMDPRLVVALFDLPREADVSALVLRFGGECELVWLNDKNALSVFSDPARAATAMRRLDQGSVYHGASVLHQNGTASSGSSAWSKDVVAPSVSKANPWKKAVLQESDWKKESSWGSSEEWSPNAVNAELLVRKEKEGSSSNRWTVLESGSPSRLASEPKKVEFEQQGQKSSASDSKPSDDNAADVVDDWEKAYD